MKDLLVFFGKLYNAFYNIFIIYLERTYRKAPQKPPSSVHVYGINPSTVKVVWRYVQPSPEEEPLKGYKVAYINYVCFYIK